MTSQYTIENTIACTINKRDGKLLVTACDNGADGDELVKIIKAAIPADIACEVKDVLLSGGGGAREGGWVKSAAVITFLNSHDRKTVRKQFNNIITVRQTARWEEMRDARMQQTEIDLKAISDNKFEVGSVCWYVLRDEYEVNGSLTKVSIRMTIKSINYEYGTIDTVDRCKGSVFPSQYSNTPQGVEFNSYSDWVDFQYA